MIFLDAAIIIYLIEQPPQWGIVAAQRVKDLEASGETFATSELVRFECLVGPLKANDAARVALVRAFFSSTIAVSSITRSTCELAAEIRARFRFKPLDSLHLAAAVENGCHRFLTADQLLAGYGGLPVEVLRLPTL